MDSVLSGRKAALSFCCTSASRPAKDPSGPPTSSQTSTTSSGHTQSRRVSLAMASVLRTYGDGACKGHPRAGARVAGQRSRWWMSWLIRVMAM